MDDYKAAVNRTTEKFMRRWLSEFGRLVKTEDREGTDEFKKAIENAQLPYFNDKGELVYLNPRDLSSLQFREAYGSIYNRASPKGKERMRRSAEELGRKLEELGVLDKSPVESQ